MRDGADLRAHFFHGYVERFGLLTQAALPGDNANLLRFFERAIGGGHEISESIGVRLP